MTWDDILVRLNGVPDDLKHLGKGASEDEIAAAEVALGLPLPHGYRSFLRDFGWGGISSWELYGLGKEAASYLNLIEMGISERTQRSPQLPAHLLPIMEDGFGNLICLDTKRSVEMESPVVFWDHEHEAGANQIPDTVANDFNEWIATEIDASLQE